MSYIERKKIKGKDYFYLSKNIRVSGDKWKKIRKYVGTSLENIAVVEKELALAVPIKRLMTLRQMQFVDLVKTAFLEIHKVNKGLWKIEKSQLISFIYNTNAIEGNSLSYEDTGAILEGKTPKVAFKKRDVDEVKNMKKCIDFLFEHNGPFNEEFMLKLHSMQMAGVHPEAGRIRTRQNIVGNYLPPKPEEVKLELAQFFNWYRQAEYLLHPFELAALVHLKLVRIHPFMDGNGRISRLLMNYVLLKKEYPLLNIFNSEKMFYYLTLKEVDAKQKEKPFVTYLYHVYLNQYKNYLLKQVRP